MNKLNRQMANALDAVAAHFGGTWDLHEDSPHARLKVGGRRIAIECAAIQGRSSSRDSLPRPRLRFDKVVRGMISALRADPGNIIPDGEMVIVTVTAPIRQDSKTTAALQETIRESLSRRGKRAEIRQIIHGNHTAVRRLRGMPRGTAKVVVFVHNPGPDPGILLDLTQSLAECIGKADQAAMSAKSAADRWLVIASHAGIPYLETWQQVLAQLAINSHFKKILLVLDSARVGALKG